jgi:hypothetical protein
VLKELIQVVNFIKAESLNNIILGHMTSVTGIHHTHLLGCNEYGDDYNETLKEKYKFKIPVLYGNLCMRGRKIQQ